MLVPNTHAQGMHEGAKREALALVNPAIAFD